MICVLFDLVNDAASGSIGGAILPGGRDLTTPDFSIRFILDFAKQVYDAGISVYNFLISEPPDFQIPYRWNWPFGDGSLSWVTIENPFPSIWSMMLGVGGITIGTLLIVRLISHFLPS